MNEVFDLGLLKTKYRNPRKIGDAELERLKKSVTGFSKMLALRPIVYDPVTMEVLGGNQRLRALLETGHSTVPAEWVRSVEDFSEEEKRRFVLTDNSLFVEWDDELLAQDYVIEELADWGIGDNFILDNELEKSVSGNEIKKENISSFNKTHILLSFHPQKLLEIQGFIDSILKVEGIEYEQSSN